MNFLTTLATGRVLILDGAMGTMLQEGGMPVGCTPERYCFDSPERVRAIHERYIAAGAAIITTCTFGANPYKLDPNLDLAAYNRTMAGVARQAAGTVDHPVFVAGNLGPSGQFLTPLGTIEPKDFIAGYVKQVRALVDGGVDLFLIETQFDLAEARALVCAVREVTDLPVIVSMTFEEGLSLTGSTPEIFVETMDNMGVDCIGTNCSLGPDQMYAVVERMRACTATPLMVEPNAGLPQLVGSRTVFPLNAEEYAEKTARFAGLGVSIIGGCCGTTPAYIEALRARLGHTVQGEVKQAVSSHVSLTSRTRLVRIGADAPFCLIGERINPTGKKTLTRELAAHSFETALRYADEQCACGADVLDVNVGAPLVDEVRTLPELACLLLKRCDRPLSLDSSNMQALAAALPYCPGSALINSINGEGDRLEVLAPLCARFGAPFVLLPLMGKDLPVFADQRIEILKGLLKRLEALSIPRRLVLVDILALTVSANAWSARECLRVLAFCRDEGLSTTLGLSNISFGLPARELVNATFLSMAAGSGLTSCIANPMALRVREALAAIRVLKNQDPHAEAFIAGYASWTPEARGEARASAQHTVTSLYEAVIRGDREHVLSFVQKELDAGKKPFDVVQEILIPAITEVGEKYERRDYFLPQLLRSAETMQAAFDHLKPLLLKDNADSERPVIVLATVEGDIHDIGKNIVSLLLSNHGFEVIDCGKDVPAQTIVACAQEHKAAIIGLSALMTTTMVKMEETIRLIAERGLSIKVIVGGACVTQDFADSIGADAYCPDAVSAVFEAKRLLALSA